MNSIEEQNKAIVIRFNKEVIENGSMNSFKELVSDEVTNHSAQPGMDQGAEGMKYFLMDVLRAGFPDLKVEILEQVAERDLVTTRKKITAKHTGTLLNLPPSDKHIVINIIDIIRLKNGKYIEHWGASNFSDVIKEIS